MDETLSKAFARDLLKQVRQTHEKKWPSLPGVTNQQRKVINQFCAVMKKEMGPGLSCMVKHDIENKTHMFWYLARFGVIAKDDWTEEGLTFDRFSCIFHRRNPTPTRTCIPLPVTIGIHALARLYQRVHGGSSAEAGPHLHQRVLARLSDILMLLDAYPLPESDTPDLQAKLLPIPGGALLCDIDTDGTVAIRTVISEAQMSPSQLEEAKKLELLLANIKKASDADRLH